MTEVDKHQNRVPLRRAIQAFLNTPISSELREVFEKTLVFDSGAEWRMQRKENRSLNYRDFFGRVEELLKSLANARAQEEREGGIVQLETGPVEGVDAALIINHAILLHRNFKSFLESLDKLAGQENLSRSAWERAVKAARQAEAVFDQVSSNFSRTGYSRMDQAAGLDKQDAAIFAGFQFVQATWLGIVDEKLKGLSR